MIIRLLNTSDTQKICLSLDKTSYPSKPTGATIGGIRRRLEGKAAHAELTIEEIAKAIEHGQTIQGALLRDKQNEDENTDERFVKQQIFCIDIDNDTKGTDGAKHKAAHSLDTPEEILKICETANIKPCIISESFSSGTVDIDSNKIYKYHVLFAAEYPVEDVTTARNILLHLQKIFSGYADAACKDSARIIFGTSRDKKVYIYGNTNNLENLLPPAPDDTAESSLLCSPETLEHEIKTNESNEEADADILLDMINPNSLDYNEWLRVSAAYKSYPTSDYAIWERWNSQYTKVNQKKDKATYEGLTGEGVTKGSLKYFAELHSPEAYHAYINSLNHGYTKKRKDNIKMINTKSEKAKNFYIPEIKPEIETWGEIHDFSEDKYAEISSLNLNFLPNRLAKYVEAVSQYCDVDSDMCILPLLSMLSLCLQGKAVVKYPTNKHTEPINLYALTIVTPGQRKSEITKLFRFPIDEYQQKYNTDNATNIKTYRDKVEFYESAIRREKNSPKGDLTKIQTYRQKIDNLTPYHNKKMYLTDCTPEALARELYLHGERMGVFADENTFIEILGGIYSKSGTNFNIVLCGYDGSPYSIARQTAESVQLYNPLLTVFSMVQDEPFYKALHNKSFSGKGLLERFLFSFPKCKIGDRAFRTPDIPKELIEDYRNLVKNLLEKPIRNQMPILQFDAKATGRLEDYFNKIQKAERKNGDFEGHEDYAEKQFAKVMRIAGLLHLVEHTEHEKINAETTTKAIAIGIWSESQALKAFGVIGEPPEIETEKYIVRRLQTLNQSEITKRELNRLCQICKKTEINSALESLDERNMINYITIKDGNKGRPKEIIKINPKLKDLKIK